MTLTEITSNANKNGLANADMDLLTLLKFSVLQEFLLEADLRLGNTWWRRRELSQVLAQGDITVDLPADFDHFSSVYLALTATKYSRLDPFEGDDEKALFAMDATTQGIPSQYRVIPSPTPDTSGVMAAKLSKPVDSAYTLKGIYYWGFNFGVVLLDEDDEPIPQAMDEDDFDLTTRVPPNMQWLLVEMLKMEILKDRFEQGDQRLVTQAEVIEGWWRRLTQVKRKELGGMGRRKVYMG